MILFATTKPATAVHNGANINRTFSLPNDSAVALRIERIVPSCGCTSAVVEGHPEPHPEIPAHGMLKVTVTLDAAQLLPGPFDKTVAVYVYGQKLPFATLEITGQSLPAALFSAKAVNLSNDPATASSAIEIGVRFEPGPLLKGSTLRLTSDLDNATLREVELPIDSKAQSKDSPVPAKTQKPLVMYRLSIPPKAILGHFHGSLTAILHDGEDGKDYPAGTIPINEEVTGELAALPNTASFGSVTGEAKTELMITAATKAPVTVTTDSKFLTATVVPFPHSVQDQIGRGFNVSPGAETKHATGVVYNLTLQLAAGVPEGPFSANVDVRASDGSILRIPVYALVGR